MNFKIANCKTIAKAISRSTPDARLGNLCEKTFVKRGFWGPSRKFPEDIKAIENVSGGFLGVFRGFLNQESFRMLLNRVPKL